MRTATALCATLLLLATACATTKPAPDTAPPVTDPEPAAPGPAAAAAEDRPTSRYDGKDMRCAQVQECHQKLGAPPSDAIWACDAGLCQARGNDPTP